MEPHFKGAFEEISPSRGTRGKDRIPLVRRILCFQTFRQSGTRIS